MSPEFTFAINLMFLLIQATIILFLFYAGHQEHKGRVAAEGRVERLEQGKRVLSDANEDLLRQHAKDQVNLKVWEEKGKNIVELIQREV